MKKLTVKEMCLAALMAALLCVTGPLSLPIGPVPISLATLVVYLTGYVLGWKLGSVSVLLYLILGAVGVPVFSNFQSGLGKLTGPTGGYLIGYLPLVIIVGIVASRNAKNFLACILAMVAGTAVLYTMGTAWLAFSTGMTASAAIAAGVLPFLIGDAAKILIAAFLGYALQSRLRAAKLAVI